MHILYICYRDIYNDCSGGHLHTYSTEGDMVLLPWRPPYTVQYFAIKTLCIGKYVTHMTYVSTLYRETDDIALSGRSIMLSHECLTFTPFKVVNVAKYPSDPVQYILGVITCTIFAPGRAILKPIKRFSSELVQYQVIRSNAHMVRYARMRSIYTSFVVARIRENGWANQR